IVRDCVAANGSVARQAESVQLMCKFQTPSSRLALTASLLAELSDHPRDITKPPSEDAHA
ncbi:hypothetical protein NEUTE1DRAFT_52803, partial [Neurospora tetrasperma FGSC 2508]